MRVEDVEAVQPRIQQENDDRLSRGDEREF